jgi:hypothetical protein
MGPLDGAAVLDRPVRGFPPLFSFTFYPAFGRQDGLSGDGHPGFPGGGVRWARNRLKFSSGSRKSTMSSDWVTGRLDVWTMGATWDSFPVVRWPSYPAT